MSHNVNEKASKRNLDVTFNSLQDILDSDTLLDEEDLKKPDPASLKSN